MTLYRFFRGLFRKYFSLFYQWQVIGTEHIPKEGAVILCSNHISLFDPPLVGCGCDRQVHFMAKEELFHIPVISWLITQFGAYPVKRGVADRSAIRTTLKILGDGKILGIFPEGTRSKTGELGQGHSGVALFALKSDAVVIPVAVIGPYKLFRPIKLIYGQPLDLSLLRAGKADADRVKETTELIMDSIKALRDQYNK